MLRRTLRAEVTMSSLLQPRNRTSPAAEQVSVIEISERQKEIDGIDERIALANLEVQVGKWRHLRDVVDIEVDYEGEPEPQLAEAHGRTVDVHAIEILTDDLLASLEASGGVGRLSLEPIAEVF